MTMQWRKAPEALVQAFDVALPADAAVQRKKMFGYPAAFVNANMFAGLYQESVVVRLPEPRRAELASAGARPFEPMPGRVMREYLVVPEAAAAEPAELAHWLDEAFRFVAAMPAREPKPRRKK